MSWWLEKPFRMIQNNLRDIDGAMDASREVEALLDFGANVVQLGCGGISAFTETGLDFQVRSPFLEGDKFGELLEKCHENGIRVIARFDFSKAHEKFLKTNPEWFSRDASGNPIRYHDTAAACLNAPYQQEKAFEVIREIITKYPVDGIFFNMFGYQTRDYDGRYAGICQCESCRKRFFAFSGTALPKEENPEDPVYRKYLEFKAWTVSDILKRIREMVKEVNPEIAVSTYTPDSIDIIRAESNSAVDRPYPFWIYSASDNTAEVNGSWPDKVSSNVAINAVDIPYRFMGVSKHLTKLRLLENMANGSNLDWCIIGSFPDYPDRENFEAVKEVFHFHRKYERLFAGIRRVDKKAVVLVKPQGDSAEYRGIFRMLKEAHILFDVVSVRAEEELLKRLQDASHVIFPGTGSDELKAALLKSPACIIASGAAFAEDEALLKEVFGIRLGKKLSPVRGSYLMTTPKTVFKSFPERDWVYLDMEAFETEKLSAEGWLPLVSAARYGPPERCFGHEITDVFMVSVAAEKNIYFPFRIGSLYYQQGYEDFKKILLDVICAVRPVRQAVVIDAVRQAEVFYDRISGTEGLLQVINLSGFNGTTVFTPLPLPEMTVRFTGEKPVSVRKLYGDETAVSAEEKSYLAEEELLPDRDTLKLRPDGAYGAWLVHF